MTRKKRKATEKSRYKHKTTGDHCTFAAYVAEMMCLRKAEYENEGSLSFKFWNTKKWSWTFKKQLFIANKLKEQYSEKAILQAINSNHLKRVFSLNHPKIIPTIKACEAKLLKEQAAKPTPTSKSISNTNSSLPEKRKASRGTSSLLSKLRNIENNGKENEKD